METGWCFGGEKLLLKPAIQAVLQQLHHELHMIPASYNNRGYILKVASLLHRIDILIDGLSKGKIVKSS